MSRLDRETPPRREPVATVLEEPKRAGARVAVSRGRLRITGGPHGEIHQAVAVEVTRDGTDPYAYAPRYAGHGSACQSVHDSPLKP